MNPKKYTLKPGRHQFKPGSYAVHHNDNLSDEEAAWYLARYPHIAQLFICRDDKNADDVIGAAEIACRVSAADD